MEMLGIPQQVLKDMKVIWTRIQQRKPCLPNLIIFCGEISWGEYGGHWPLQDCLPEPPGEVWAGWAEWKLVWNLAEWLGSKPGGPKWHQLDQRPGAADKPKVRGSEGQQVKGGDPSPCCVLTPPLCLPSIAFLEEERSCCPAACPSVLSPAPRAGGAEWQQEGSGAGRRGGGGWQQQGCLSAVPGCAELMCGQWDELVWEGGTETPAVSLREHRGLESHQQHQHSLGGGAGRKSAMWSQSPGWGWVAAPQCPSCCRAALWAQPASCRMIPSVKNAFYFFGKI